MEAFLGIHLNESLQKVPCYVVLINCFFDAISMALNLLYSKCMYLFKWLKLASLNRILNGLLHRYIVLLDIWALSAA